MHGVPTSRAVSLFYGFDDTTPPEVPIDALTLPGIAVGLKILFDQYRG
jgi:hypothetical protein